MLFFYNDDKAYHSCSSDIVGFEFGGYYRLGKRTVRCIRTTQKAFNFLDVDKGIVLFKTAFYPIKPTSKAARRIPVVKEYEGRKIFHCNNLYRKIHPLMFIALNFPKVNV